MVENATEENRQDLFAELNVMKNLEPHQNVIQLLRCVTKFCLPVNLVSMDLMQSNWRIKSGDRKTQIGVGCIIWIRANYASSTKYFDTIDNFAHFQFFDNLPPWRRIVSIQQSLRSWSFQTAIKYASK